MHFRLYLEKIPVRSIGITIVQNRVAVSINFFYFGKLRYMRGVNFPYDFACVSEPGQSA